MDVGEGHRRLVGEFVRARRRKLRPEAVGLPAGAERRGDGLRRAEVAALAYVSVTLYTWLEQGRDFPVSSAALNSVANALQLDESGRAYLLTFRSNDEPAQPKVQDVSASLRSLIERHAVGPAYVMTRRWDIVMWNALMMDLFGPLPVAPWGAVNALWWVFSAEHARTLYPGWREMAQRIVSQFRLDFARYPDASDFAEVVEQLRAHSDDFAALWQQDRDVQVRSEGHIEVVGNDGARRRFSTLTMVPQNSASLRAVFFLPAAPSP
jgi:transcriptional regulator with XRE-family HTH domain